MKCCFYFLGFWSKNKKRSVIMNSLSSRCIIIIIVIIIIVLVGSIIIPITILYSEKNNNKANTTTITSLSIGPTNLKSHAPSMSVICHPHPWMRFLHPWMRFVHPCMELLSVTFCSYKLPILAKITRKLCITKAKSDR